MTGNREVITASDFKRMVSGAYSEFLLEYENINQLPAAGKKPGTHVLRTMGAAIMPLHEAKDDTIGGLARRVAAGAVLGARGTAGVVLAQMFRGIAKGLAGKYDATSSEFGKAFQYGILYAQRALNRPGYESQLILIAKAVAKNAYRAVRDNKPISEILEAAIAGGRAAVDGIEHEEAGARIMMSFLMGCLRGLDGNFVSPAVSLSLGLESEDTDMPDPRHDLVRPYCVRFQIRDVKVDVDALTKQMKEFSNYVVVEPRERTVFVHMHTEHPGEVLEQGIGWGPLTHVHITDMSEGHVLEEHEGVMRVAMMAVAENKVQARELQEAGISILLSGSEEVSPSVAGIVNAAHSDLADTYVMLAWSEDFWPVLRQAKWLLGNRIELVLCADKVEQAHAARAFDPDKTAKENAAAMCEVVEKLRAGE